MSVLPRDQAQVRETRMTVLSREGAERIARARRSRSLDRTSASGTGGGSMHGGRKRRWVLVGLASLGLGSWIAFAGSLEPPGPPAPTLAEVEPRIAIHAGDLPMNIGSPGSYYLAENISTGGGGITIAADNVSIDLKGFTLQGG